MSTGDEGAENLVDSLLGEVDDQFNDLERQYTQAREDLVVADSERRGPTDPLEASNERYALLSQVAALQSEVSRQADELDERDRMLAELGEKISGFQADIADRDVMLNDLHQAKQDVLDERREQSRLQALLDARAAERQELADVAHRLQNERDHVQELLTTAIQRFDEAEVVRVQLDDKLRHIEAARDTAAHEHDARAHELIESRAEMSKLTDKLDELARAAAASDERAEKADALAERRANEAGYLNRRIDAMTEKLETASGFESESSELRRELAMSERRITELERTSANLQSELEAANAAVEAIASRTSDYDELVAQVAELEQERDAAWEAASGYTAAPPQAEEVVPVAPAAAPDEVADLADRARELGARRANEAEAAAQAAETAAAQMAAADLAAAAAEPEPDDEPMLLDLDQDDEALIDSDLASVAAEPAAAEPDVDAPVAEASAPPVPEAPEPAPVVAPLAVPIDEIPRVEYPVPQFDYQNPTEPAPSDPAPQLNDTSEIQVVDVSVPAPEAPAPPPPPAPVAEPIPEAAAVPPADAEESAALELVAPALLADATGTRKRTILPTDLVPNTPETVAFLLNQPGVTAIVDARSTCGRTGIRPSDLFERIAAIRDHFDVPIEVVVTPVSTPVGGAPDLPAIGVHHVTGADTVADRIRALCMGFPADQPLVVIAGDDHVRRAAIGEEANVVEPSAVLETAAD